jgi:PAB1-binding protein PBP1
VLHHSLVLRLGTHTDSICFASGNAGFRTDSAISSTRFGRERDLQRWVPDASDDLSSQGLGNHSLESSNGQPWDQFAANEQKFGITTTYDENMYTTRINVNHPEYKQRVANAEKISRDINSSDTNNAHVLEERVMDYTGGGGDQGADEEDK